MMAVFDDMWKCDQLDRMQSSHKHMNMETLDPYHGIGATHSVDDTAHHSSSLKQRSAINCFLLVVGAMGINRSGRYDLSRD